MKGFSEVWIVHYVQIGLYLGKRQISPVLLRWIEMNLLTYHDLPRSDFSRVASTSKNLFVF